MSGVMLSSRSVLEIAPKSWPRTYLKDTNSSRNQSSTNLLSALLQPTDSQTL